MGSDKSIIVPALDTKVAVRFLFCVSLKILPEAAPLLVGQRVYHKQKSSMNDQTKSLHRSISPGLCLFFAALAILPPAQIRAQSLGSAESFAALGATTVTNTGTTHVNGNVGVSPGTGITGFPPGQIANGAIHANDSTASQAHASLGTAYTAFAGLTSPPANNLSGADLGGMTLAPGVYRYNNSATLGARLTFDAQGDAAARFVVQIGTTLITSGTSSVVLINGANARNVFFQVGSSATLGAGSSFIGNILAYTSVTTVSGSTVTGRLLAVNGAVTMDTNDVTMPMLSTAGGKADFDGDKDGDFVFENLQNGQHMIWLLNNGQYQTGVSLPTLATAWQIASAADFNADGYADLIWQNLTTGQRTIWLMKNGQFQDIVELPVVELSWQIASAADFNADGYADLVWQNLTTGQRTIWFLKNGVLQGGYVLGTVETAWQIAGAADFNADGHADLVWQNLATGQRSIWFLKNGQQQSGVFLSSVDTAWRIVGAADFDADGHADLVWEYGNSSWRTIWLMKNGVFQSSVDVQRTTGNNWKIAVH